MWKRCSEGLSGLNCEEGKVEKYTWDDTVKRFKNVECAGYKDWRMPTKDELETLVYCSKDRYKKECNYGSEYSTINQQAFPNTYSWYWSRLPHAGNSDSAWFVNFSNGVSVTPYRDDDGAVRLVRGGH